MNHPIEYKHETPELNPGLYLIATPIGNLRDITLRALDVLAACDAVYCEDTRVTRKLLKAYGISTKLRVYNDYSKHGERKAIISDIMQGRVIGLVSDAGMPMISDPGYKLVAECLEQDLLVTSVPGANAALAAMQLSGLPTDQFSFHGFFPPKSGARRKILMELRTQPGAKIFYESPNRVASLLEDIDEVLGDAPIAIVREITKMFEESRRGSARDILGHYKEHGTPKGEIVIVIGQAETPEHSDEQIDAMLADALKTMSTKNAASAIAEMTGRSKKELYARALGIGKDD